MKLVTILMTAAIVGLFGLYLIGKGASKDKANIDGFDLEALRRLPVQEGGRVKPLDTFARTAERVLLAKEEFVDPTSEKKLPAIRWFIEVAAFEMPLPDNAPAKESRTGIIWSAETFRIDNDQVLALLELKPRSGLSYALKEFYDKLGKLEAEAQKAKDVPPAKRDLYQTKLLEFRGHLEEFLKINQHEVTILPPLTEGGKWESPAEVKHALQERARDKVGKAFREKHDLVHKNFRDLPQEEQRKLMADLEEEFRKEYKSLVAGDPRMSAWDAIIQSYRDRNPARFEKAVAALASCSSTVADKALGKTRFEVFFNHFEPFVGCYAMYVFVVILAGGAMLTATLSPTISAPFRWSALGLIAVAFAVHTFGIVARMYIQGRPPVTNLYSSAIFIGWGGVLMAMVMELVFPRGIVLTVGAVLGLATTVIAHNLGTNDTLEMMQAVLDTNFWLATHVTIVTLGYMATFLAGLLGLVFVALGVATPLLNRELWKSLSQMIYGVLCAATVMSFTGTVLGGIWADQSWGRFWGWDPKENGAVLIVLWNVIILHARWGGMVKQRGIAVMTIFGNIVTAWSWFGTNMLGVGLHSYGFMEGAKGWLIGFCLSQVVFMIVGLLPQHLWLSVRAQNEQTLGADKPGKLKPKLA